MLYSLYLVKGHRATYATVLLFALVGVSLVALQVNSRQGIFNHLIAQPTIPTFHIQHCCSANNTVSFPSEAPPFSMCLHPRGDYVADFVYAAGGKDQKVTADSSDSIYESKLRKEMLRILAENGDPDAVVLDIGGNIGLHTVFLANAGYKVHVFEPFKGNFDLLKCTVMSNPQLAKNVVLNNFGLSDVAAKTCIVSNPANHGGSVIQGSGTENCTAENTVEVRRLDDYLHEHQIKPYLVKIDVEGYEYKALSTTSTFFKENPPSHIFSEFVSKHFKEQGEAEAYLELFYQLGYNVKWNENVVKKGSEKCSALMKAEFADIHMYQ